MGQHMQVAISLQGRSPDVHLIIRGSMLPQKMTLHLHSLAQGCSDGQKMFRTVKCGHSCNQQCTCRCSQAYAGKRQHLDAAAKGHGRAPAVPIAACFTARLAPCLQVRVVKEAEAEAESKYLQCMGGRGAAAAIDDKGVVAGKPWPILRGVVCGVCVVWFVVCACATRGSRSKGGLV